MNSSSIRGRHRAPGRHHPLHELRTIARESAQPALKGVVVIVAAGGLVATFATTANADALSVDPAGSASVPAAAAAAIGPTTALSSPQVGTALAALGLATPAKVGKAVKVKPLVIEDVIVKAERAQAARVVAAQALAAAKAKAKAERAVQAKADAQAAASQRTTTSQNSARSTPQRASRSTSRPALTSTTSKTTTKPTSNSYTPSAPSGTSGTSGTKGSRNWATPGQCTWGALSQWYGSEGYYPAGWTGNALAWGYGAARAGYTVSSTPRTRSILVMQPGVHGSSSYAGHVAWVTAVNGNQVTVIEMNALAGAYNYNTRTLSNIGGMQYIYAP